MTDASDRGEVRNEQNRIGSGDYWCVKLVAGWLISVRPRRFAIRWNKLHRQPNHLRYYWVSWIVLYIDAVLGPESNGLAGFTSVDEHTWVMQNPETTKNHHSVVCT